MNNKTKKTFVKKSIRFYNANYPDRIADVQLLTSKYRPGVVWIALDDMAVINTGCGVGPYFAFDPMDTTGGRMRIRGPYRDLLNEIYWINEVKNENSKLGRLGSDNPCVAHP